MRCLRCGNTDKTQFHMYRKRLYCTACVQFGRLFTDEFVELGTWQLSESEDSDYTLPFALTDKQQACIELLLVHVQAKDNVLVYACCGAGKTELILPIISYALCHHLKIGMAIPRRDVVIELMPRLQSAFPKKQVSAVYGGHHDTIDGDIILCTTHQLYRYPQVFDILILDEVDAFPYKGDKVLQGIAQRACKGNTVYLSATPDDGLLAAVKRKEIAMVSLFKRPHGKPLCLPIIHVGLRLQLYYLLWRFLCRHALKTVLLYMPSIAKARMMSKWLQTVRTVCLFTSHTPDRAVILERIKSKVFQVVVCTTVMERGITIPDVQVAVWEADHAVFDSAVLVQIMGRVGRSVHASTGEGIFLCLRQSEAVQKCFRTLQMMNDA